MSEFFSEIDEIALRNSYSPEALIHSLTLDDVERFLRSLGVADIDRQSDYLICPTICHNPIDQADSMKLYYYDETKNFHCYTECSCNFSIIALYQKYMVLNHQEVSYGEAVYYLRQFLSFEDKGIDFDFAPKKKEEPQEYKQQDFITLPAIEEGTLDLFMPHYHHPLWLNEGITEEVQDQFDIRFSYAQNRIVIPHRDIDGRLVGIRGRAIEEEDIAFGKYRPIQVGTTMYNHQLGFNLYGLWEHRKAIETFRRVVIYEGEKSVLKDSAFYGRNSVAVATCGSQLNRFQINLLVKKLHVDEITLAYDKEFEKPFSAQGEAYRKKLIEKCQRYSYLTNFYYLFDERGLLEQKDAPCDKGKEVLETLMKRRITVI